MNASFWIGVGVGVLGVFTLAGIGALAFWLWALGDWRRIGGP